MDPWGTKPRQKKEAALSCLFQLWLLVSLLVLRRRRAGTPLFHEDHASEEKRWLLDYRERLGKDISSFAPTHPLSGLASPLRICFSDPWDQERPTLWSGTNSSGTEALTEEQSGIGHVITYFPGKVSPLSRMRWQILEITTALFFAH